MAFVPRTFEVIRDDMWNYVRVQTNLTDFEIGAVVRATIEAAALEDDEQYFQMVQLLDAFSINTATGSYLDERVADFNIERLTPAASAGPIVIRDLTLIRSDLTFDAFSGSATLELDGTASFPTAGYPYTVRIGEGTAAVEDVSVTNNNTGTGILTLAVATLNDHSSGDRVAYVSGAADRILAPSIQVQVPSVGGSTPIRFVTTEGGTLVNGNFESTPMNAKSVVPGAVNNVGAGQVTQFVGSAPFTGAGVTNTRKFGGGRDLETDAELRDRARAQIQALSRGTITALKQAALGVADDATGQRVVTASVREDLVNDEVVIYIDDGTGFTPDAVTLAQTTLAANPAPNPGAGSLVVVDASEFPASGYVIVSDEDASQIELVEFSSVNYGTNTLTLVGTTARTHNIGDRVTVVDPIELAAQANTTYLQTQNFPIVRSSLKVWRNDAGGFVLLVEGADYLVNRGTGEIELVTPLIINAQVVATYAYYTGLVKTVQTVIDGDDADLVNFPGVRAAGVIVVVEAPIIHRTTVRLSISAEPGVIESTLVDPVREAVEAYISSLGIGEDVIVAEIVARAMAVAGVYNVVVISPTSDIIVLQNELPMPFDSSGNSLVSVT